MTGQRCESRRWWGSGGEQILAVTQVSTLLGDTKSRLGSFDDVKVERTINNRTEIQRSDTTSISSIDVVRKRDRSRKRSVKINIRRNSARVSDSGINKRSNRRDVVV